MFHILSGHKAAVLRVGGEVPHRDVGAIEQANRHVCVLFAGGFDYSWGEDPSTGGAVQKTSTEVSLQARKADPNSAPGSHSAKATPPWQSADQLKRPPMLRRPRISTHSIPSGRNSGRLTSNERNGTGRLSPRRTPGSCPSTSILM